jgi:acetoacetyl-CoA synthetase
MAAFYLESIRRLQPEGPYFIAGFSFGGLVALEMARTLLGTGHEVALLALLDTFPHTRFWPLRARLDSWRRLARISISAPTLRRLFRYHRDVLHAKPLAQKFTYVAGRGWRAAKIAANIFRLGAWLRRFADLSDDKVVPAGPELPAAIQRVQRAGDCAYARYRPGRYPGEIAFIKAASEHSVPFLAEALWGRLAARLNVVAVPGDHQNLVRANAAFLARELTELLRRADFTPVR